MDGGKGLVAKSFGTNVASRCPVTEVETKPFRQLECHKVPAHLEDFGQHVLRCTTKRHRCGVCDKIFKEKTYLQQHMKRQHPRVMAITAKVPDSEVTEEDSEGSGWDNDPDVDCEKETAVKVSESEVSVGTSVANSEAASNEVPWSRKRTQPMPVATTQESTERQQDGKRAQVKDTEKKHEIAFKLVAEEKDKLELKIDQEVVLSMDKRRGVGDISINLGDYLETASIKPEDVTVTVRGRTLEVSLKATDLPK